MVCIDRRPGHPHTPSCSRSCGTRTSSRRRRGLSSFHRFSLLIPVPRKQDEFLVPALLRDTSGMNAPASWPASLPDAPRYASSFTLTAKVCSRCCRQPSLIPSTPALCFPKHSPARRAAYSASDLAEGFLPIGAFHRLCASALGSSRTSRSRACTSPLMRVRCVRSRGASPRRLHHLPTLPTADDTLCPLCRTCVPDSCSLSSTWPARAVSWRR